MKKIRRDLNFKDVWTFPFKKDPGGYSSYVWDSKSHICFDFLSNDYDLYDRIVKLLNGDDAPKFKHVGRDRIHIHVSESGEINDRKHVLLVRGWGHLTGGLKLSSEEAIRLQDELLDYCVSMLEE